MSLQFFCEDDFEANCSLQIGDWPDFTNTTQGKLEEYSREELT